MDAQWADMLRLLGSRRPALLAEIAAEVQGIGRRRRRQSRRSCIPAAAARRPTMQLASRWCKNTSARNWPGSWASSPASLETDQPLSTFGLDSLLALELKNNLEGRLDFTLPMAKLMEGPSIASLAAETSRLLAAGAADRRMARPQPTSAATRRVDATVGVAIESGNRPPLILLPALGGDIRYYADLVQQLGDDQPVYAFRPRGIDQDLPPHLTMEEMIADYLAALRELQPAGPYYLAGWSTGGVFAFALAEALERAGEEVGDVRAHGFAVALDVR